jgi:hypothetical protein
MMILVKTILHLLQSNQHSGKNAVKLKIKKQTKSCTLAVLLSLMAINISECKHSTTTMSGNDGQINDDIRYSQTKTNQMEIHE